MPVYIPFQVSDTPNALHVKYMAILPVSIG